jgi:AcrR family transcriptional regulator
MSPQPVSRVGRSERTRAAILNATLDFIWSHPFRDMTVSALMDSTGLSRSAFYQYFKDVHEVMESLLDMLRDEVFAATGAWFEGDGDPVLLLNESLSGLVDVCYRLGPILRATNDAATTDKRLEKAWMHNYSSSLMMRLLARIEADQQQGLIPMFDARPVAVSLNRLDAYTVIDAFGQRPRKQPEPVREALVRIWVSTLYGSKYLEAGSSDLVRT